jgi:hypothetical protein
MLLDPIRAQRRRNNMQLPRGGRMTDDRDNPLLLAVEALTKPQRTKVLQDTTEVPWAPGTTTKLATVELPSLLEQLQESINATIGIGGSGSLANERNMLNNDALHRFMQITSLIGDWARLAGAPQQRGTPPGTALRAWYAKYSQTMPTLDAERFYIRQMTAWAQQIAAMYEPPKTPDLPDPCPLCGATDWFDPKDGQKYPRPLILSYRPGPDLVDSAKGMCRACGEVWGARELAYAIEEVQRDAAELAEAMEEAG